MKITSLKPLADRVAIRPDDAEDRTPGGILLPENSQARPRQGTVVAVGPGRHLEDGTRIPVGVAVGDRVCYSAWGETEQDVGEETWFVLRESDLIGVLGEE